MSINDLPHQKPHGARNRRKVQNEVSTSKVLSANLTIKGAKYLSSHTFTCGKQVPLYEVTSVQALNQLIGNAKFNNRAYGNVYYRGECHLHNSLIPALYRKQMTVEHANDYLSKLIHKIRNDSHINNDLKIQSNDAEAKKSVIEGMLQHYGIPTRFIDVVDNHWIALWMGLNQCERFKQLNEYYHYEERSVPLVEFATASFDNDSALYQYILMIAVPFSENRTYTGMQISPDYIEVDLRQALPSIFLRPHAQHGLVIRKKAHVGTNRIQASDYDLAPTVIGIIQMRIDKVKEWIGSGSLLSQSNLFPPPAYDYGYDLLLSRNDLFSDNIFPVIRYV